MKRELSDITSVSRRGQRRTENQDAVLVTRSGRRNAADQGVHVLAVADGVGGLFADEHTN